MDQARRAAHKRQMSVGAEAAHRECYGCAVKAREPWEHATWCAKWRLREGGVSGA
jgi:hypothetical protein